MARIFPWRAVVLPWLVTRAVTVVALTTAGPGAWTAPEWWQLNNFDGGWFRAIVLDGYGTRPSPWPPVEGPAGWSRFPFFPLFPLLGKAVHAVGVPVEAGLVGIAWAATLVAMAGLYRLAARHVAEPTARLAVWLTGLLPGAVTLGMAYSDGLFLAGCVWAVAAAEDRQWGWAGAAALVATAARPNGGLILVTVALVAWAAGGRARAVAVTWAPSAAFLASWSALLWRWTGDPLAFLTAKDAWFEVNVLDLVSQFERNAFVHLVLGAVGMAAVVAMVRRLPAAWSVHTALCLVPSLALGLTGLGRYAAVAFPVPIALAMVAHAVPARRVATGVLVAGTTVAMVAFAVLVTRSNYVP